MRKNGIVILAVILSLCLWATPVMADMKDFFDEAKVEAAHDQCDNEARSCAQKCNKGGSEDPDCKVKCWKRGVYCTRKAVNEGFNISKMPKEPQKFATKLAKSRDKAMEKCSASAEKCGKKCKDAKCFNKCSDGWIDCSNAVQKKYGLNNKDLAKMLKGKKP